MTTNNKAIAVNLRRWASEIRGLANLVDPDSKPAAAELDEQVIGVGNGREVRGTPAACERVSNALQRAAAANGLQTVINDIREALHGEDVNRARALVGLAPVAANYSGEVLVTGERVDPWVAVGEQVVHGPYEAVRKVQDLIGERSEIVRICNEDLAVPDSIRRIVGVPLPPRAPKHHEDALIDEFAGDVKQGLRKIRANQVGYISKLQGSELVGELRRALAENRPSTAVACLAYMRKNNVSPKNAVKPETLHFFRLRELADEIIGECRAGVYVATPNKLAELVGECIHTEKRDV